MFRISVQLTIVAVCSLLRLTDGAMNCEIKGSMQASNYELSTDARAGIMFKDGQSVSSFQGFDCTCGTDDVSHPLFDIER